MFSKKFFSRLKFIAVSVLLAVGLFLGLIYSGLFFQYKKITVSPSAIEIIASNGHLKTAFGLTGNNPFPFAISLRRIEGKISYGVLARKVEIVFQPELLIPPGRYQLTDQRASLAPGYPVTAEDTFLSMLRGKNLQLTGDATLYVGSIKKSVPVSLNLTIEEK